MENNPLGPSTSRGFFEGLANAENVIDKPDPEVTAEPTASAKFFGTLATQDNELERHALNKTLGIAVRGDPDKKSDIRSLSQTVGLPDVVVDRNRELIEQQARIKHIRELTDADPILRRQMIDPDFASIAHDDVDSLSGLSHLLSTPITSGARAIAGGVVRAGGGLLGFGASQYDITNQAMRQVDPREIGEPEWLTETIGEGLRSASRAWLDVADTVGPDFDKYGFIGQSVLSGLQSVGMNVPFIVAGVLTRNPQVAAAGMSTAAAGEAYMRAVDEHGFDPLRAVGYALPAGAIEYITELYPAKWLIGDITNAVPFAKALARQLGVENIGEQFATALGDLNDWLQLNPEGTFKQYMDERPSAALQTMIATTVAVGFQTGAARIAGNSVYNSQQAKRSAENANLMSRMMAMASVNKVRERDVTAFQQFIKDAAEDGPIKDVFISGAALQQAALDAGVELGEVLPSAVSQIDDAIATGGDVRLPLDEVLARVPGSALEQAMLPHVKTEADGMTQLEAEEYIRTEGEQIQKEVEAELSKREVDSKFRASQKRVEALVLDRLNRVGKFSKDVNKVYATVEASMIASLASRTRSLTDPSRHMTPEEFAAAYPLPTVSAQGVPGQQRIEQAGSAQIDTPEFKAFFGDSQVVDEDGNPLVVYHGTSRTFTSFRIPAYFVSSRRDAEDFSQSRGEPKIVEAYLSIKNPVQVDDFIEFSNWTERDVKKYEAQGYDGAVLKKMRPGEPDMYIAFRPTQIKSATGNRGTFSPTDANILRQSSKDDYKRTSAFARLKKLLTPAELGKLRRDTSEKLLSLLRGLPSKKEMASVALAGSAKRGWYQHSAEALVNVFGADAPRFAAMLAATSPQTSVENNLINALNIWKNWLAQGRPYDERIVEGVKAPGVAAALMFKKPVNNKLVSISKEEALQILESKGFPMDAYPIARRQVDLMGVSVQGKGTIESVLDGWVGNSLRAMNSIDPGQLILSGPKVNSFFANLVGITDEVTNDAWMANYALVDQTIFSGSLNVAGTDPGKGPGYMAMSARTRETAQYLTELTGEEWTPAEVQETVWSWAKTVYELAGSAGENRSAVELLRDGAVTDDLINSTPDFRTLFHTDTYQKILEEAGYGEQVRSLQAPVSGDGRTGAQAGRVHGKAAAPVEYPLLERAARRLDRLREQRQRASADGQPRVPSRVQERPRRAPRRGEVQGPQWLKLPDVRDPDRIPAWSAKQRQPDAVAVYGIHYSYTDNLTELDPSRAGTGSTGTERRRFGMKTPRAPGVGRRVYFYAQSDHIDLPVREATVRAGATYRVRLDNLYDLTDDPRGLKAKHGLDQDGLEEEISELGYDGLVLDALGSGHAAPVAVVFDVGDAKIPVQNLTISQLRQEAINDDRRIGTEVPGTAPGGLRQSGGVRGGAGVAQAPPEAPAGDTAPVRRLGPGERLQGLPETVRFRGKDIPVRPLQAAREAAQRYMASAGLPYAPPTTFARVEPGRAKRIADAYDAMAHAPNDPRVREAYAALIRETLAQYQFIKATGLKIEMIPDGQDPYADSPRAAIEDVHQNNHLWVFPTAGGFGGESSADIDVSDNLLLEMTDEFIGDYRLLANDVFRIVHDYFGHIKEGVGFRAHGEENAWRQHSAMYSPLARMAMTSETRGQNSWVNFGPYGEHNQTASAEDTEYAAQKSGLMDEWVATEGAQDEAPKPGIGQRLMQAIGLQQTQPPPQAPRGEITFGADITQGANIAILENADLSTYLHELGHWYLEVLSHLAAQPNAPQAIVDDMNRLLKWFGVADNATWRSMTLDEKRESHELFAEGFESYLFEGNAPAAELTGIFARIRAWMKHVYKEIGQKIQLSDEVRGVFDRMIATDEQIDEAQKMRGYVPLFKNADEADKYGIDWDDYLTLNQMATAKAEDFLREKTLGNMKWLDGARSRKLKQMQREQREKRKEVEKEVYDELYRTRVYGLIRFLKHGTLPDDVDIQYTGVSKIDAQALAEHYEALGGNALHDYRRLGTGKYGMMTKGEGLPPQLVADAFGFRTIDEMVTSLIEAEDVRVVAAQETDRRMLERHGELATPEAMAEAVNLAIANDARARFLETELKALSKAMGKPALFAKAIKKYAKELIARQKVRDVMPAKYEAAAERASRAADKTTKLNERFQEKRNHLINHHAAKEAHATKEEIRKALAYLKSLQRAGKRKGISRDYLDQIDALLERYELRQVGREAGMQRQALRDWVKKQQDQGFDPQLPDEIMDESRRIPYQDLSVEEFRGMVDAVKQIENLGKLENKLLAAKRMEDLNQAKAAIIAAIEEHAPGTIPTPRETDRGVLVGVKDKASQWLAMHRKFASIVQQMDGFNDDGAAWQLLVWPMNERGSWEVDQTEQYSLKLAEVMKPLIRGNMTTRRTIGSMQLSREECIGIALNMGNEVNADRVKSGERINTAQLQAILNTLDATDLQAIQAAWDLLEQFRPMITDKQKRIGQPDPKWVDAAVAPEMQAVADKLGVKLRGGYYPIAYSRRGGGMTDKQQAEESLQQTKLGRFVQSQTRDGHLKSRAQSVGEGKRLRYDFASILVNHGQQVIHDLAWHEWVTDTNRILRSQDVKESIVSHYGDHIYNQLLNAVDDIATGQISGIDMWDGLANHMRYGASIVGMGWRLTTAAIQVSGLSQSMARVGTKWVMKGMFHWIGDAATLENSVRKIREKSTFMRHRGLTMQREMNEMLTKIEKKRFDKIRGTSFLLIQKMQLLVDVPTWWGAYEKAMSQDGMTEERAVALADQAVIDSQGSGQLQDLAKIERGNAWLKLWTTFYSYFNTLYNMTSRVVGRTNFSRPGDVAMLATDLALLYTIPSLIGTLMYAAFEGDWDDPEKLAKAIVTDQISYLLGTVVGLRELAPGVRAALGEYGEYRGPAGTRLLVEMNKFMQQSGQLEIDEAFLKAAANMTGTIFHLPLGQVANTVDGLNALANGETDNPGVLVVGHRER